MGTRHVCIALLWCCAVNNVHSLVSKPALGLKRYSPMTAVKSGPSQHPDDILRMRGGEQSSDSPRSTDSNKWVPSASAEVHDNINLVVLTLLGLSSIWALCVGEQFFGNLLTWIGFIYISLDSLWLIVQPSIVKSPRMILGHHIATLLVLLDPLLQPSHSVYTSACLLVEARTYLLATLRSFFKRTDEIHSQTHKCSGPSIFSNPSPVTSGLSYWFRRHGCRSTPSSSSCDANSPTPT
jgi:hypothetical protein